MQLSDALADALEREAKLRKEHARVADELADVQLEVRGLRLALDRHGGVSVSGEPVNPRTFLVPPIEQMPRTDAIEAVLGRADGPMSPRDIEVALREAGRDDEYSAVSAALAHLLRSSRVHSLGRGQWVVGPDPNPRRDEAEGPVADDDEGGAGLVPS